VCDGATQAAQQVRHDLHISNSWNVCDCGLADGQKGCSHQFQDGVLGSTYVDLTDQSGATLYAEAIVLMEIVLRCHSRILLIR
jgi:hypothetical protein